MVQGDSANEPKVPFGLNSLREMRFGEWRAYFYCVTRWIFGIGMSPGPRHVLRWLVKFNTLGFQALIFGIHIGYVNMQLDKIRPVELIPGNQNERNSMRMGAEGLCADVLATSNPLH